MFEPRPSFVIKLPPLKVLIALLFMLFGATAHALTDEAATEQVRARLVASVNAVYPGAEITLGVNQRIIPHWHTYWLNPGDSGLATTIQWRLPSGASASDIQWPTPSRITLGPITNFGYSDEVTLLSAIKVPEDAVPGGAFPIAAKVEWLVCEETCIPQEVELGLVLPVVADAAQAGAGSPLIEQARAALPVNSPWPMRVAVEQDGTYLRVSGAELQAQNITDIYFFPDRWGRIVHGAPQPKAIDGDAIILKLQPGEAPLTHGETLAGVLTVTQATGAGSVVQSFTVHAPSASAAPSASIPVATASLDFLPALLLALAGGVILNLMPCVFPVLSIKALSLIRHAHHSPLQARLHGLTYTCGILVSFALLGSALILLKTGGAQIGWGFQFQSPLFVLAVAYLMFAVGINLSGVFSIGGSIAGMGSSLADRSGYTGSFFTGVLATIVATPCTAPFMGAALGYAMTQPPVQLLAVFLSLGFGLALPYLLLSTWPLLQRLMPRPGVWMERVKQGLAFPMYAAAVWLVWVLAQQAGTDSIVIALGGMVLIALAAWSYDITRTGRSWTQHIGSSIAISAVAIAIGGGYFGINPQTEALARTAGTVANYRDWEPYSPERLQTLRTEGKPVFLNFTAAWCISCLVNERVALRQTSVTEAFRQSGIAYLKGDWTNQDPRITEKLAEFARTGVPLYIFYPAGIDAKPVVLPQILTADIVLNAIKPVALSSSSFQPTTHYSKE